MKKNNQFTSHLNQTTRFRKAILPIFLLLLTISVQITSAETRYRIQSQDNLNSIVERFYNNSEFSKSQLMVAILVKNPRAFKGGNINFLLRGKRLKLPNESEIGQVSPKLATQILSRHAKFHQLGLTGNLQVPSFETLSDLSTVSQLDALQVIAQTKSEIRKSSRDSAPKKITKAPSEQLDVQTKKIDKLQQESDNLRKQLEELLSSKADRNNRLLELEKILKEQNKAKLEVRQEGKKRAEGAQQAKSLEKNTVPSASKEPSVQLENKKSASESESISTSQEETSFSSNALWMLPLLLLLLGGFIFRYFSTNKNAPEVNPIDDTIEHYEETYIEENKNKYLDVKEETDLETSVKLDVARAYIEAEDTESAVDILHNIIAEGTDNQRSEARQLLGKVAPKIA